jgi:hypothetical protein
MKMEMITCTVLSKAFRSVVKYLYASKLVGFSRLGSSITIYVHGHTKFTVMMNKEMPTCTASTSEQRVKTGDHSTGRITLPD